MKKLLALFILLASSKVAAYTYPIPNEKGSVVGYCFSQHSADNKVEIKICSIDDREQKSIINYLIISINDNVVHNFEYDSIVLRNLNTNQGWILDSIKTKFDMVGDKFITQMYFILPEDFVDNIENINLKLFFKLKNLPVNIAFSKEDMEDIKLILSLKYLE